MQLSILYVTIGLPILLGGHYLNLERESKIFLYSILACNVLLATLALSSRLKRIPTSGMGINQIALGVFFSLAISTAHHEWGAFGLYGPQQKAFLGAALWLLPGISLPLLCSNLVSISSFFTLLERGLALVASSVLLSAVSAQVGIEFGEVLFFADSSTSRAFGPLGDQVGFACALGLLLAFARGVFPLVILHGTAIALTGTRGALLVSLIGGFIFSVSLIWSHRRERGRYIAYLLSGILILALILHTSAGAMILSRLTHGEIIEATMTPRLLAMELAIEMIKENSFLGLGFGGFYNEAIDRGAHLIFSNFVDNHVSNSTNQFLEMMVSGGLVGFSIYILFLWKAAGSIARASRSLPPEMSCYFKGAFLWFLGMVIGNQAATWIQICSLSGIYFILLPAIAERSLALFSLIQMAKIHSEALNPGSGIRPLLSSPSHRRI